MSATTTTCTILVERTIASRPQNRGGTYSTLSLEACSLRISRLGPAAILQSQNPSTFPTGTVKPTLHFKSG
ncbi:hypothetical protein Y032_0151g2835 [Ancylostoma ceylanicum]|uniref:Uncharacterized protein n=1 Tax=Ancylostoma ceylanicum TaxID=53326 RepID=A0A016T1B9_9BILA|nr:hypothetical protein Y032_0151g2835 [Ancylostoma ceylanicum]